MFFVAIPECFGQIDNVLINTALRSIYLLDHLFSDGGATFSFNF